MWSVFFSKTCLPYIKCLTYARAYDKGLVEITALHPHTTALVWGRYHWFFCFMHEGMGSKGLSAQWHIARMWQQSPEPTMLFPVVYTTKVIFGWLGLKFHSTDCCWRKVKIHLIHQPREWWFPLSLLCAVVPVTLGCPPTPDTNFRQPFFFFWLLWASGKEDSWLVYSTLFRPVNCLHALTSPANNSCVGFKWCERPHMFERIIYPCEIALSLTLRVSASNCVSLFFFFSSLYWSSTICLFIFSPSLRNRNWNALYI